MSRQINWFSMLLWAIYLTLLAVLLPQTAWAFGILNRQLPDGWVFNAGFSRSVWVPSLLINSQGLIHKLAW
jgi:hypothetical protein